MPTQAALDNRSLYERDHTAWADETAARVRAVEFEQIDWEALSEEIDELAGRNRRELASRLSQLLMHLLKWQFQPEKRSRSWQLSIAMQRNEIRLVLRQSPSLRREVEPEMREEYPAAARLAAIETGLPEKAFPVEPPFIVEQVLDDDFLP
ncbi:MAG: DUF29 domain-containing protein [Bryobacteraceae bacterium]|nr:DUF29 domain-containing protein [Bryobacteraceae bacterium]